MTRCVCYAEPASDSKFDTDTPGVASSESHHNQQQQQACDSIRDDSTAADQPTGSRLIVTTTGGQQVPQTSPDSARTLSSSVTETTPTPAHCSVTPTTVCPSLYPVYPPYIVMGISVQPFTYPPPQSDPAASQRVVAGNRKRPCSKLLPPEVKRRARKQQRHRRGDVVSSTTPDSSLLETTSGRDLSAEMTSAALQEAEVESPLCLAVSRDKFVYDSCGALDLTVRKTDRHAARQ